LQNANLKFAIFNSQFAMPGSGALYARRVSQWPCNAKAQILNWRAAECAPYQVE
jgi:hypothetical protein